MSFIVVENMKKIENDKMKAKEPWMNWKDPRFLPHWLCHCHLLSHDMAPLKTLPNVIVVDSNVLSRFGPWAFKLNRWSTAEELRLGLLNY